MASTLLSSPCFLSLPNGKVGAGNFRSSFYGKLMCTHQFAVGKKIQSRCYGNSVVVASVLGRKKTNTRETVIPEPDYRIPIVLLGLAGGLAYSNNLLPAAPVGLLGALLLFQEVKVGNELQESGENVFVGGKNRWKYSTFVNWELWWPNFPILVYFKETQTKPEGQVHFFPNGKQLYDVMVERAGSSKTSGPKDS
ncbi:hypothetical protein F8388_004296 [Cannabis sativa]|uniref:DUF3119 family protein n=1 Tax=Cannabis sativa TaxID=3483 RepID=A0A7J6H9I9_CANSA|nr:hypothetical protein F8388_004296 [Cannabis sativa]